MNFVDIIEKKKTGEALTSEEIHYFVKGVVSGEIPDYQASAFLMAVIFKGMDRRETFDLTMEMMHSGDVIDLSSIDGIKVDKHSTGGVGDKTTLVLGPLAAACGCKLAKMSGRGLGFTGGTIDKLESIPGVSTSLSTEQFVSQVNRIGLAVAGQTGDLVPADKKLYALRDVTGTVNSIPLIASSIMSKKLAAGSDVIVLDVKYGKGAFMKDPAGAEELASLMIDIGTQAGRKMRAIISSMEEPLGFAAGNLVEVREAIETLNGKGPDDLRELCVTAGSLMLSESGIAPDESKAREILTDALNNGSALNKLAEMIKAQGGEPECIFDPERLPSAPNTMHIYADSDGYIESCDALAIGCAARDTGAGRIVKGEDVDPVSGVIIHKKSGDKVCIGDVLADILYSRPLGDQIPQNVRNAFKIVPEKTERIPLIYKCI
ncbi:MAG: thymidine phosphorylase [Lachnospiraceae bacterium]|nr:thymidine phosphorylase [Lachnospiraceae bacterium]